MRVLHLTGWPIPETVGGTEVFVASLSRALQARGVLTAIGCLDIPRAGTATEYLGVPVYRFRPAGGGTQADFVRWLDAIHPDIVNVHCLVEGLEYSEIEAASRAGYPVVLTAHVPGVVCRRDSMLHHGESICAGKMQVDRCSACYLQFRGVPSWAAELLTRVPERLRLGLAAAAPSRLATGLSLTVSLKEHFATTHALFGCCRKVIAVCQWLYDALKLNGVPESKLVLCRQATDVPESPPTRPQRLPTEPLHVGYLGRYDPTKGVEELVRAVRGLPRDVPIRLSLHGTATNSAEQGYLARICSLAADDPRICIGSRLERKQLAEFFAGIHVLAVPSIWLETGPLVVYEAFAHGVPVLGSRRGGIAELVRDGIDGWLLPAGDVRAWQQKLQELAACQYRLLEMKSRPPALRNWDQVAGETETLYRELAHQTPLVIA